MSEQSQAQPTLNDRIGDRAFLRRLKDLVDDFRFDGDPAGRVLVSPDVIRLVAVADIGPTFEIVKGDVSRLSKRQKLTEQLAALDNPTPAPAAAKLLDGPKVPVPTPSKPAKS